MISAWSLLLVILLITLAFKRTNLKTSSMVMGGFTVISWLFSAGGATVLAALIVAAVLGGLTQTRFRANTITRPIFKIYKKLLPTMSETESTALEAGTVWWEGEIFSGKPNWSKLLNHPSPSLSQEEQNFLDNQTETLASMVDEWQISRDGDMPKDVWDYMMNEKFFAMIIPKEYGGLGFSAQAQSAVLQKLSSISGSVFSTVGVPNSLGPAELLLKYGTQEQKNYYLPRLADGREIPCFGLTGPRAGSDATSLPDTGVICRGEYEGKSMIGIRLNFSKRYITLAPVATVVGLAFRMFDPEGLLGEESDIGITVALLPRGLEGMDIGRRHKPLGSPFMNGPIRGKDVFIPLDFIIGGAEMKGEGWRMLVECLSVGRCITLPSSGAGGSKYAVASTGAYARIRRQFNVPVAKLEGVQETIARIVGNAYISAAGARVTAIAIDQGEKPAVPSAILKYNLTEMARQTAIDAMDVHGGKGIIDGPGNYLASGYASVPVAITVEGANILTRSMITFGQGAIRCHPYVLPEMHAAQNNSLEDFDKALFSHFGMIFSNAARSLVMSLTNAALVSVPVSGATRKYYQKIDRYSASFAFAVDMCMFSLGGQLKFRELISARLADMVSKLYLASCVLKHWDDQGQQRDDLPVVDYSCRKLFAEFEDAMQELIRNLPNRPVAWMLRAVTLPLGRRARKPGDRLVSKVVGLVTAATQTRERLIQGIYRGDSGHNPLYAYDSLLCRVEKADPIYRKIGEALKKGRYNEAELTIEGRITQGVAIGILTEEEGRFMLEFEKDVLDMINVDDFPLEHFGSVAVNHDKSSDSSGRNQAA
ncbi:acyl-CoA dehydrogenase [Sansalvadorimonas sp. 2012CJ34-2]|uniref:Acyl-coenzyme A dehydrogenase n=1 Tax=Parendozoicomonas callyspongiae TaxID=2942213 RepID=A0ABT0PJ45_9GAMM|nr:acyl-CoA dehydrogenase [Sansalvadorimonas sp. 2012CJ34-2]MCL6271415.1 acyl-CoA dehydrogenase [Sansalvadorimonas sp. 2012CJ34-2]